MVGRRSGLQRPRDLHLLRPQLSHCDHCGELIHGHCTTYQDKVYCRTCGDRFPLCLDCYWQACGRCRFCQEKKPPDGDTRCQECLSNRVQTLTVAQDLLDEVHWFCRDELGLTVQQPYKLKLADTAAAIPKLHSDAYLLSLSTVGLWVPKARTMWAVKGYPFWFTSAVLAHEHAHAWQQETHKPTHARTPAQTCSAISQLHRPTRGAIIHSAPQPRIERFVNAVAA